VTNLIARVKRYFGITSPSLAFLDALQAAERRPYVPPAPRPWYAARAPGERWETAAKRRNARLTRRALRRDADPWAWLDDGSP
jgi:hypothetical protein